VSGGAVSGRRNTVLHLNPETGRFVPAYWLVYSAIAVVGGVRPPAVFMFNAVVLAPLLALPPRLAPRTRGPLQRCGGGVRPAPARRRNGCPPGRAHGTDRPGRRPLALRVRHEGDEPRP